MFIIKIEGLGFVVSSIVGNVIRAFRRGFLFRCCFVNKMIQIGGWKIIKLDL